VWCGLPGKLAHREGLTLSTLAWARSARVQGVASDGPCLTLLNQASLPRTRLVVLSPPALETRR